MQTKFDDLEKLYNLKEKGIITEDEYLQKKNELMQAPVVPQQKDSGIFGILGFVLAIVSLSLPIPYLDALIGVVALILSIIGMLNNRALKGLAIAGLIVSIIAIVGNITLVLTEPEAYELFSHLLYFLG